jgi:hypothetical protein
VSLVDFGFCWVLWVSVGGCHCFLGFGFCGCRLGFGYCGCSLGVSGVVDFCWGVLLFFWACSRFVRALCILPVY